MKTIIEKIIQLRNPGFSIDSCVDSGTILQLTWVQLWSF
jgi:hypothetical protein